MRAPSLPVCVGAWQEPKEGRRRSKREKGAPKEPPFDVAGSVWAPRAQWCDSKDLVDSDTVEKQVLLAWRHPFPLPRRSLPSHPITGALRSGRCTLWTLYLGPRAHHCAYVPPGWYVLTPTAVGTQRISNDWWRACAMGVDKLVEKYDDDGQADADGNGISDELEEIEALL